MFQKFGLYDQLQLSTMFIKSAWLSTLGFLLIQRLSAKSDLSFSSTKRTLRNLYHVMATFGQVNAKLVSGKPVQCGAIFCSKHIWNLVDSHLLTYIYRLLVSYRLFFTKKPNSIRKIYHVFLYIWLYIFI